MHIYRRITENEGRLSMTEMTLPSLAQLPTSLSNLQTRMKETELSLTSLQSVVQDKLKSDQSDAQNKRLVPTTKEHDAVIDTLSVRVSMVESRVARLESTPTVPIITSSLAAAGTEDDDDAGLDISLSQSSIGSPIRNKSQPAKVVSSPKSLPSEMNRNMPSRQSSSSAFMTGEVSFIADDENNSVIQSVVAESPVRNTLPTDEGVLNFSGIGDGFDDDDDEDNNNNSNTKFEPAKETKERDPIIGTVGQTRNDFSDSEDEFTPSKVPKEQTSPLQQNHASVTANDDDDDESESESSKGESESEHDTDEMEASGILSIPSLLEEAQSPQRNNNIINNNEKHDDEPQKLANMSKVYQLEEDDDSFADSGDFDFDKERKLRSTQPAPPTATATAAVAVAATEATIEINNNHSEEQQWSEKLPAEVTSTNHGNIFDDNQSVDSNDDSSSLDDDNSTIDFGRNSNSNNNTNTINNNNNSDNHTDLNESTQSLPVEEFSEIAATPERPSVSSAFVTGLPSSAASTPARPTNQSTHSSTVHSQSPLRNNNVVVNNMPNISSKDKKVDDDSDWDDESSVASSTASSSVASPASKSTSNSVVESNVQSPISAVSSPLVAKSSSAATLLSTTGFGSSSAAFGTTKPSLAINTSNHALGSSSLDIDDDNDNEVRSASLSKGSASLPPLASGSATSPRTTSLLQSRATAASSAASPIIQSSPASTPTSQLSTSGSLSIKYVLPNLFYYFHYLLLFLPCISCK